MNDYLIEFSYIRKANISFVIALCVSAWNISGISGQSHMKL